MAHRPRAAARRRSSLSKIPVLYGVRLPDRGGQPGIRPDRGGGFRTAGNRPIGAAGRFVPASDGGVPGEDDRLGVFEAQP
jgi:hypothetical protein